MKCLDVQRLIFKRLTVQRGSEVFAYQGLREGALDSYSNTHESPPLANAASQSAAPWTFVFPAAPQMPRKDFRELLAGGECVLGASWGRNATHTLCFVPESQGQTLEQRVAQKTCHIGQVS